MMNTRCYKNKYENTFNSFEEIVKKKNKQILSNKETWQCRETMYFYV